MSNSTCTVDDCVKAPYGNGFCQRHYNADYYRKNRDEIKARARDWAAANPDRKRAADKAWVEANPERKRTRDARIWASKPERNRANHARWYADNKERNLEGFHRRKARKLANGYERVSYVAIIAEHGMICHICTLAIESRADLHFDHVIPLSKGGPHFASNIRPAHATCNLRKASRILTD